MIVVTVFLSILNQMDFHLVQNRKKNCHHDHIPFNVKGNANIVFSVYSVEERGLVTDRELPFLNCVEPNKIWIVTKFFRLTLHPKQNRIPFVSESIGKSYNPNLVGGRFEFLYRTWASICIKSV